MTIDEAYKIIAEEAGSHFDPRIVKSFMKIRGELESYLNENR